MGLWTAPAAQAQAPANDDPCGAVTLTPQGSLCTAPTVSTNLNATTTTPNGYSNAGSPLDVWFKFTTAATGPASFGATITVNGNPASFVQLFSGPSCAGPLTGLAFSASNQANTTAPRLITGSLQASTTYYVRVAGNPSFNDAPGAFTICVSDGPGTATCAPPTFGQVTYPTAGTAQVTFTPGANSAPPYVVTVQPFNGGSQTLTLTTLQPIIINNVTPGVGYTVTVGYNCATGGQGSGTTIFTAPVPNDEPCTAITLPVSSTCVPVNGTNATATTSPVVSGISSCGPFGASRADVWYSFTTAAAGSVGSTGVVITTTGAAASEVRVFQATSCTSGFAQVACIVSNSTAGGVGPLVASGLTPGTLYYVAVSQVGFFNTAPTGPFTICVVGAAGCAAPTGLQTGIVTETQAPLIFTAGNGNQSYSITYTPLGGASQTVTTTSSPYTLTGLAPGTQYTATVQGVCAGGTLSAPATVTFSTRLTNDEPCTALPATLSTGTSCATPISGSAAGATTTTASGVTTAGCAPSGAVPRDVWYTFTTAATGAASTGATFTLGTAGYMVRVFAAASCNGPFTQLGCAYAAGAIAPPLDVSGLTPSTTYYVSVSSVSTNGAGFTLCISGPPACPSPTGLVVGGITQAGASVSFGGGTGNTSYTVTYQAAGGAVQTVSPAPVASPVVLAGLSASTTYTVTVQAVCPAGTGTVLRTTFTTSAPPGTANDDCYLATPITSIGGGSCGTPVSSTTVGATASQGIPAPGCAGSVFNDVWFSVVVPANGILRLETNAVTGSPLTDTGMALYTGSCSGLTLVACDDDTGTSNFSLIRQTSLPPGSTVYVRVWTYGSTSPGAFTICAQTDAACPAVTALTTTAITTTSAQLAFSGPGNATGYTVTLTPAGGTAITSTATASPVAFTGLTPGTIYAVCVVTNCTGGLTGTSTCASFSTAALCPAVSNLTATSTGTTGTVAFTGPANAGSYRITYTAPGGTAQTVTATTSPVTLPGLQPFTSYAISVVVDCGGGLTSLPVTATLTTSTYCTTNLGGACGANALTAVAIVGTTLNNTTPTCTSTNGNAYSSYPGTGATTASLGTGRTYQFQLNVAGDSDVMAWIDYNRNGQFEASEGTQVALSTVVGLPVTASFTVPATAALGTTGLRLRTRLAGAGNGPGDACASFGSGEVQDYLVTIVLPSATHESALAAQVALYPNPATAAFTLTLPAALSHKPTTAILYNSLGQQIRQQVLPARATGTEARFEVAGLPHGVYSVQLATEAGLIVKRLVVE